MYSKTILIVGAGLGQVPAIKKSKEMGLKVIAIDKNPKAEGMKFADKAYSIDVIDKKGAIRVARKHKISGVMTIQSDLPIPTVIAVADALNLPGVNEKTGEKCSNKIKMRLALKNKKIPQPNFFITKNFEEAVNAAENIGYPCIVKAPNSSGSRGITKVERKQKIKKAYKEALKYAKKSDILIEEYIEGLEIGAQAFCVNGKCIKVIPHNDTLSKSPFMIPVGHSFPLRFFEKRFNKINKICTNAVEALNITDGPSNIDIILDKKGKPNIIEIGARIGATCLPELVKYHTGIDWIKQAILCSIGEKVKVKEKYKKPVAALILESPKDGILKNFKIPKSILNNKRVYEIEISVIKGALVNTLKKGTDRIGKIIVMGKTADKAEKWAKKFKSKIIFKIK